MKLVEILARELKEWPYDCSVFVSQDRNKDIAAFKYRDQELASNGYWSGESYVSGSIMELSALAEDSETAIVTHAEYQAAVDALGIPKFPGDAVEWNGEGLPPVGAVCEIRNVAAGSDWEQAAIAFASHNVAVWSWAGGPLSSVLCTAYVHAIEMRPIRTPEQIAEEEREAAIREMAEIIGNRIADIHAAVDLYDAGYRKQEQK